MLRGQSWAMSPEFTPSRMQIIGIHSIRHVIIANAELATMRRVSESGKEQSGRKEYPGKKLI